MIQSNECPSIKLLGVLLLYSPIEICVFQGKYQTIKNNESSHHLLYLLEDDS